MHGTIWIRPTAASAKIALVAVSLQNRRDRSPSPSDRNRADDSLVGRHDQLYPSRGATLIPRGSAPFRSTEAEPISWGASPASGRVGNPFLSSRASWLQERELRGAPSQSGCRGGSNGHLADGAHVSPLESLVDAAACATD